MDNTIMQMGTFLSDGNNATIKLPAGADWVQIYNMTQLAASQTTAVGVKYTWLNSPAFVPGGKLVTYKSNAVNAANLEAYVTSAGFTLVDSSVQVPGVIQNTITAISNASIPVVTNSGTNGLVAGNVVRLTNVAGVQQFGGMDFTVGYNTLTTTTFSLDYAPQIVAGTTGAFRIIQFNPIFYPRRRYITAITQGTLAVVTLSVTHGYKIGQLVRMVVPAEFGMVEMNGLQATIIDIDTTTTSGNTISLDIDSSAFTAFTFPVSADVPFTPAEVVPMGEDTSYALSVGVDILSDATENKAYTGLLLTGGVNCPGGANDDEMIWVAGKVFSNDMIGSQVV